MKIGNFQGMDSGSNFDVVMNDNKIISVWHGDKMVGREPFDQHKNDLIEQVIDMVQGADKRIMED